MTQNFSFLGGFGSSISSFRFDALNFSKSIRKLASSLMPCNDEKRILQFTELYNKTCACMCIVK